MAINVPKNVPKASQPGERIKSVPPNKKIQTSFLGNRRVKAARVLQNVKAKDYSKELGLDPNNIEQFAKWYKENRAGMLSELANLFASRGYTAQSAGFAGNQVNNTTSGFNNQRTGYLNSQYSDIDRKVKNITKRRANQIRQSGTNSIFTPETSAGLENIGTGMSSKLDIARRAKSSGLYGV